MENTKQYIDKLAGHGFFEAIGDGLSIQDTDYKILYQNNVHKSLIGNHMGEYCYKAYEKRKDICEGCPLVKSFEDGKIHKAERSILTDKGTLYVEITASSLKDSSGNIIAGIEIARNITKRKKLEEQLHHSQRLESVGQLAAGVAHGFNNILTVIVNYSYVLLDELENEEQRLHVRQILDSAKKAARLTSELLSFGRKQELISYPVKINEIIKGVIKVVSGMLGEHIHIKTVLTDDNLIIMGDSAKIEQALMNLVTNALDAMPEGGTLTIEISQLEMDKDYITVHGFGEPGEYTLVSITDTGVGMDEKTRERIFEPFYTTKDVGKGTGLGLSIVYGIIKQHNGYINVYSEPGKGTAFKILLPLIGEKAMEEES